ncbi:hypothetical protein B9Z19DRAFT_996954 [Tuber borchii]|uniref:Uncharacterized protein n=1 Tax=Tuber borchii TaxID=42251 RepID=A0A2T6ZHN5_TUBBO|nr:hypothetical protein B9Z19DRAFT_996954 [Tuber borchii]
MQAKVFLSYLLAAILALGVIATPVDVEGTPPANANTLFENVASFVGTPGPRHTEPTITPKEGDVLAASTSVVARDLERLEKRTLGCVTVSPYLYSSNCAGELRACWFPNGQCVNLNPFWRGKIGCFRPDPDTFCKLFTGPNCSGIGSVVITYPGYRHV